MLDYSMARKSPVYQLDERDKRILDILVKDARTPLREIAKEIELSIDSVHKRIKKMRDAEVFFPIASLVPKNFGYPFSTQITINLKNATAENIKKFAAFLKQHPNVVYALSATGKWDFFIVIIGKTSEELHDVGIEIREKFKHIISEWHSAVVLKVFKYEEYDLLGLK